jgi:hypothetical protein
MAALVGGQGRGFRLDHRQGVAGLGLTLLARAVIEAPLAALEALARAVIPGALVARTVLTRTILARPVITGTLVPGAVIPGAIITWPVVAGTLVPGPIIAGTVVAETLLLVAALLALAAPIALFAVLLLVAGLVPLALGGLGLAFGLGLALDEVVVALVLEIDVEARGGLATEEVRRRAQRLHRAQHPEIMLGVLQITFRQHPVASRGGVARELLVLLEHMLGVAADLDAIRPVRIERPVDVVLRLAPAPAAAAGVSTPVAAALPLHTLEISHIADRIDAACGLSQALRSKCLTGCRAYDRRTGRGPLRPPGSPTALRENAMRACRLPPRSEIRNTQSDDLGEDTSDLANESRLSKAFVEKAPQAGLQPITARSRPPKSPNTFSASAPA